ncbi:hypothetical protein BT93_L2925 [Corymbia citriodora subsp. variegata]|uniref:NB-ARC domain-containing protein n=1 Tax=Corymbia citriodora subsp. variegata TaxID=360336 RepID=A0A8T0CVT0_CORYI|nr:hypothetical protein BT93_L2925 [Corymbia citriodora subsp. variegata]
MADTEVAVALAIDRLRDLLSKSEVIITYQKITDQIPVSISNLQGIINTRRHAYLNQRAQNCEKSLLLLARSTEKIAEEFLDRMLRDHMSKPQIVRFFSGMNRVCAREKMAEEFMAKVKLPIQQLKLSWPAAENGLQDNERASSSSSSQRNRENMRQRVEYDIAGRDQSVDLLLAGLINPDPPLRVIAVVGEQHCGKTALVRSVFNMLQIKHHFDCRAWVSVLGLGAESDWMKNLLVQILIQMPARDQLKDLKHKKKEELVDMVYQLLMEKRYLIVLDNWGDATLINDFLRPFVDSNNGSRVIVTSTDEDMQEQVDPWTHKLPLCPEFTNEECEELLLASFNGGQKSTDRIKELMKPILEKCNHSPPAISLLGGLFSAAEVNNFEALVDQLGNCPTVNDFVRLSFDELPYMMKPCILYMALFPKESEVPTRRLFREWAAEGLLAEAAEESMSAEDCFHELERRNLIRVVRRKPDRSARTCRVPAFLHEFFRQKAEDLGLLQIQYSSDSLAEQNAPNQQNQAQNTATGHYDYKVRCLQSFASFNTCKPGTQAREIEVLESRILDGRPNLLRVLDLEGVYKPVLPEKFGNILSNLRYLGLRWTALDSIPESVGNLLLLETLDLKHTNITKVTSAIWNAKNLRHLYLSEASFDKSIQRHISSGESLNTKLETLWGLFIETADSPMLKVLKKLRSLKKLGVTCRPGAVKAVTECISELAHLESLRLRSRDLFGQPAILDLYKMKGLVLLSNLYLLGSLGPKQVLGSVLPRNLKTLTLSMSGCEDDPMPVLQHLNHLIDLRLLARSCSTIQLCCEAGFPKLRFLKIWMLKKLHTLVVKKGAMCNLEELDIKQCKKLEKVIGLDHINSLKIVSLTRVKKDLANRVEVHQDTLVLKSSVESRSGSRSCRQAKMTVNIIAIVSSKVQEGQFGKFQSQEKVS